MPVLDTVLSGAPEFLPRIIIRAVSVGTEIKIIQEGVPDVIPVEACCLGWQESLSQLCQLVQAEIPE